MMPRQFTASLASTLVALLLGLNLLPLTSHAASVADTASEIGRDVSRAAQQTLKAVERNDPRRLSAGEIVAWLVVGCAVGALAGRLASSPSAWYTRVLLGLAGAFVGGVLVDLFKIDFRWGSLVLRYEELAAALAVALLAVYGGRFVAKRFKRSGRSRSSGDSPKPRKD